MRRYLIRRLIQAVAMLFVMSIVFFLLIHAIPGGPDRVLFNPKLPPSVRLQLRHQFGLDQPLYVQYWNWLTQVLHGNFGYSFVDNQPVMSDVGARVGATVELFVVGMLFARSEERRVGKECRSRW